MYFRELLRATSIFILSGCAHIENKDFSQRNPASDAHEFSGYSDYRLFLARNSEPVFDPNQDITLKTRSEEIRSELKGKMEKSLLMSIVPFMGTVNADNILENLDVLSKVEISLTQISEDMRKAILEIKDRENNQYEKSFPIVEDLFLIPWKHSKHDLFYSSEKISSQRGRETQILLVHPKSTIFADHLTTSIKELFMKQLKEKLDDPVFFLGMISNLHINPYEKSHLKVHVLVGLRPQNRIPFEEKNDQVHIKNAVIPQIENRGPVASLVFDIDLSTENPRPATLNVELGDFDSFALGVFKVSNKNKASYAPRLEGVVNKKGVGWVAMDFAFDKLKFSLENLELDELKTKTRFGFNFPIPLFHYKKTKTSMSAGFRFAQLQLRDGDFSIKKVDEQFGNEINNTINSMKEDAMDSAVEKISNGRIDLDTISKAFNIIMGKKLE